MSKLILSMMVTLDGLVAGRDGNLDWFRSDAEFETEMLSLLRNVDAMIFGRVSYELLAQYWPGAGTTSADAAPGGFTTKEREREFAHLMNTVPKIVCSRTLAAADWGPARIEREVTRASVERMKQEARKDVVLFAGATLAQSFIQLDLIDEVRLMIHPTILGEGQRLFAQTAERKLRLTRTRALPSGVTLVQYERA
jgi:dihydrofolate reductase